MPQNEGAKPFVWTLAVVQLALSAFIWFPHLFFYLFYFWLRALHLPLEPHLFFALATF
jgi:hypothetical protein